MRIVLMAADPAELCRAFLHRYRDLLRSRGIDVALVLIDENTSRQQGVFAHGWNVARRQARHAGCSTAMGFLKIVFYKALMGIGRTRDPQEVPPLPADVPQVRVPTLNSQEAIDAARSRGCELVCLMGTRIITAKTLAALGIPLINFHSSDPRFMRGGPAVVWEVLAGLDAITLTIHEVVEQVDAGRILAQKPLPIAFDGGIGSTTNRTMARARPLCCALFFEVITAMKERSMKPAVFTPGSLRVTPRMSEAWRADLRCRARSRHSRKGLLEDGNRSRKCD